jgi:hypothetical protein
VPFYSVYGLSLHSNQSIPGLIELKNQPDVDVQVWLDLVPDWLKELVEYKAREWYKSRYQSENGEPILKAWKLGKGEYLRLVYSDRTQFIIERGGNQIWVTWPGELTLEDTATYLLGPILGYVLRLRGVTCLHASAIGVGESAIAFVGIAGAGKSTTAATFAQAGFPVLSDDVLPFLEQEGRFWAQPAYPRVRLWASSVKALYGKADALPYLTPNWDKRYLDLTQVGYQFHPAPLPLAAIYVLSDRIFSPIAPLIEPISTQTGLINLIANTYANTLLDKTMRAQEFDLLSRVVANVPIRRVIANADPVYISKLRELILEDFQTITI